MKTMGQGEDGKLWERISPAIDKAIASLGAPYRDAGVLGYFDGRSYEELARRLKISETAARQRASRGVAELREMLARQGVLAPAVGAAAVEAILRANVVQSAPPSLVSACAVAGAGSTAPMVIAKG